jgi:hypothetical protein
VIATGFDRGGTVEQPVIARPSGPSGVLTFPQRHGRVSTPGMPAPHPQPTPRPQPQPRVSQAPPSGATDVPEMEIPTFIRRQMD